eukprot:CAMPEP_0183412842 /NCGR_PEP_ID=MMETSP0370-20130417/21289_1 /TAXON_ID=268820 /ORGANISM="Peridinium aciculiferum, Strain PAER-2" /LENGTH=173 /DNA_ID=CAMNT_0025595985 /DNA_START=493 /DNA_END=1012 /DNA_ORIENTATION=+
MTPPGEADCGQQCNADCTSAMLGLKAGFTEGTPHTMLASAPLEAWLKASQVVGKPHERCINDVVFGSVAQRGTASHDLVHQPPEGEYIGAGCLRTLVLHDDLRRHPPNGAAEIVRARREQTTETEVEQLRPVSRTHLMDKHIGSFDVAVNDGRLLIVQILQRATDVVDQHAAL